MVGERKNEYEFRPCSDCRGGNCIDCVGTPEEYKNGGLLRVDVKRAVVVDSVHGTSHSMPPAGLESMRS